MSVHSNGGPLACKQNQLLRFALLLDNNECHKDFEPKVTLTYSLAGRPVLLSDLIRFVFARETSRRIEALWRAAEA